MQLRRTVGFLSIFLILIIAFSVYGPLDYLGAYTKVRLADRCLTDGARCTITGQVYHKEIKNDKPVFYLRNTTIEVDNTRLSDQSIILYPDSDTIPNTSTIRATGSIQTFDIARNDGNFDAKNYYNSMGLVAAVKPEQITEVSTFWLFSRDILYRFRRAIFRVYKADLPGEESGFLSSITLGDKAGLDGDLKTLFQEVGLAHVLAVSGLHISVLCMGLYNLLRKRGMSFALSASMSGIVTVLYGIMTGSSVSSIRAVGMFLIYLLGQVLGEAYDMLTSLAILADVLLLTNPLYITNSGFIMSFGAILGIHYIAMPLSSHFNNYLKLQCDDMVVRRGLQYKYNVPRGRQIVNGAISGLVFSFGITLATMPLVLRIYYQIPTYSILLNAVVLPLMPILLFVGLTGGILGLVCPVAGFVILQVCHVIIYMYELLASMFNRLPYSHIISGNPRIWRICIYYVLLYMIINYLPMEWIYIRTRSREFKSRLFGQWFIFRVFLMLMSTLIILIHPRLEFEIDVLDVGQGDGTFISTGDGSTYFIDGGSTTVSQVGKYRMLPFLKYKGVASVDYWFITHGDEDHVSGLIEAIEAGYDIDNIVLSHYALDTENLLIAKQLAEEAGINIIYMDAGDVLSTDNTRLTCVFPDSPGADDDPNAYSLSLLLEYETAAEHNYRAFFGGDIASEQEKIIAKNPLISNINLLKVSHHGSKNSSDSEFLEALSPDIATISCDRHNKYGHPTREAIDRIEAVKATIYYTMNSGRIKISKKGIDLFCE